MHPIIGKSFPLELCGAYTVFGSKPNNLRINYLLDTATFGSNQPHTSLSDYFPNFKEIKISESRKQ